MGKGLDDSLLGLLVCALALARAIDKTGLAEATVSGLATLAVLLVLMVLAIFLVTWLITELLTDNSAAALMLPFGLGAGLSVDQLRDLLRLPDQPDSAFGRQLHASGLPALRRPLVVLTAAITTTMVTLFIA